MRHWLVQIRKAKGLTQQEAAKLCGISRSYYSGIECGTRNGSGKSAKAIADAFGFDMSLFFVENGRKTSQSKKPA